MKKHNELKAGLFLCTGILVLAISILVLGGDRQIFARQRPYYATFTDIKGLAKGAPVMLGGISIGRVSDVAFHSQLNESTVRVELLINETYLDRLRMDSVVTLETQGLLGDRFINISIGKDTQQLLPGTTIQSKEVHELNEVFAQVNNVVEDLSSITKEIRSGDGILHAMLFEPVGKNTVAALSEAAHSIAKSASNIDELTKSIKHGDGIVHELVYNRSNKKVTDIISELSATTSNLKLASDALAKGGGTIGALLVDSQLYDNLVEVTEGAKRSFILRQAIRSSLK